MRIADKGGAEDRASAQLRHMGGVCVRVRDEEKSLVLIQHRRWKSRGRGKKKPSVTFTEGLEGGRQAHRGKKKGGVKFTPPLEEGKARDITASHAGMSWLTYQHGAMSTPTHAPCRACWRCA